MTFGKAEKAWEKIGIRNHHGISLPLSSLHSSESEGCGNFLDLIPLIDWCKECGFDVIQLLPLNDSGLDPSPYNAISATALHPLYLRLSKLPYVEKVENHQAKIEDLRQLNATPRVAYKEVREKKIAFLKEYAPLGFPLISQTDDYKLFCKEHAWVYPYALFKAIKESQRWNSWEEWPTNLKSPSEMAYRALFKEYEAEVNHHILLQYLCFLQFKEVREKAKKEGILLKGDIPILMSRDSADVWGNRHLFLLHIAAGAPPDMYSREGQYWGFPIYDWQAMEKENYRWWKERLRAASYLYDLYRIDHVVGFFRIWTIPEGRKAKEGIFMPQDPKAWIPEGKRVMEMMLETSPMLPLGEDLGLVPGQVKATLTELGIPGTKMMRWERRWEQDGSFIPPSEYGPISMTTVTTHDSDTLKLWWRHFPKEAKLYSDFKGWDYKPFLTFENHFEILRDSHTSASLFHINPLMEYLALFPELISSDPQAERINIPGKVLATNWTYKFRPSIEEMRAHEKLKTTLQHLLK